MSEYHIGDLSIVLGGALVGLGIVVSTLISRCCRHEWENVGETQKVNIVGIDERQYVEFRQTVRCTKCGKNSWQEVG